MIIALSVNFIGDGLRDAFDPRQKRIPSERKMAQAHGGGRARQQARAGARPCRPGRGKTGGGL